MSGWRLDEKRLENHENAAKKVRVASSNHGHDGGWSWSQKEDLSEGKLSGWSTLPKDGRRCQKTARKVATAVETDD